MSERLVRYQRDVVDLLFRKDFVKSLDALAHDERSRARFAVYRRMARTRIEGLASHSFPRLVQVLGEERFEAVVARWLDEAPPRSPYFRAVAGELAHFLASGPERFPEGSPRWASDSARYEWALLDVEYTAEEEGALDGDLVDAGELSFERAAVLTPAHRIVRVSAAVHRVPAEVPEGEAAQDALAAPGDFTLCIYRHPVSHEARVLELSPIAGAIVEGVAPGNRPVVDVVRDASARLGFAIDAPFVEALSELVADLVERGVWLGSRA